MLSKFHLSHQEHHKPSQAPTPTRADSNIEKDITTIDDSPVPLLTWRTSLLGIIASMGGFIFGYSTAQISGFTTMEDFLLRFGQVHHETGEHYFSNVRNGLIVGLLSIGTMVGSLLAAPISERTGRKISITFWCIIHIVGIIVEMASSTKWYEVAVGRLVAGLGVGGLSTIVPMYQSEAAPVKVRAAIVSMFQLFVTFGIFISYIVNYGTERIHSTASWRITMGIGFAWALILGLGIMFVPESPRFLYRQGKVEEARQVMAKLAGVPPNHRQIVSEMQEMKEKLDEEKAAGKAPWYEVFTGPAMFWRTTLGIVLQSLQQLTGANFIFFYGNTIFYATGLENSYETQIIMGTVNFAMSIVSLWVVQRFRRRPILIIGGIAMFICFLIFASVGHFSLDHENPQNTPKAGTALIVFSCFFIAAYAVSWGPLIWAICGELFPSKYRDVCVSLSTASNWTWNFLLCFFTPFISSAIDYRYGYVFGACCAAGSIITYFFVNESYGRTLEEIDTMYVMHVKPWQSKNWVAPPAIRNGENRVPNLESHEATPAHSSAEAL